MTYTPDFNFMHNLYFLKCLVSVFKTLNHMYISDFMLGCCFIYGRLIDHCFISFQFSKCITFNFSLSLYIYIRIYIYAIYIRIYIYACVYDVSSLFITVPLQISVRAHHIFTDEFAIISLEISIKIA